ncbi:hypothetical protein AHAS_Ahas11G0260500 [Arachis hypogaea]
MGALYIIAIRNKSHYLKSVGHRKACYTKGTRVEPPRQQPPTAPLAFSPSADDDWLIPLSPKPCNEDMDPEANEVDSFDEHIDRMFAAFDAEECKGRRTTEFWDVDLIARKNKYQKRPLNGSKIIMRFNEELQAIGDGAGLLSGILGALGSDYSKFPICEKSWAKVQGKDKVYDDCIKNLENRPAGIPKEYWRWFIDYRNDPTTKAKCRQNALNRKKQLYTHTRGSKSLARAREEVVI